MQELEKILEEIDDAIEDYSDGSEDNAFQGFVKGLKRAKRIMQKHMNDGWIPCSDQMPETGDHVLVSFKSSGFLPVVAFLSENRRWLMLQGAKGFDDVTNSVVAWCPLPEPYKLLVEKTIGETGDDKSDSTRTD